MPLILLADHRLLALPLDFLKPLRARYLKPMARDFSIHVAASRRADLMADAVSPTDVIANHLTYLVDPRHEDKGSSVKEKPRPSIHDAMHQLTTDTPGANVWTGVKGSDRIPAHGEWQHSIRACKSGGLLFYGPGRCMLHMPPDQIAGLDARGARLVIIADRADNELSFRRQSKLDTQKAAPQLALERSVLRRPGI